MQRFSGEQLEYFQNHLKADIRNLALSKSPFPELPMHAIAQQIQGLQVAVKKFPSFLDYPQLRYPPKLNLEQSSSEALAKFKSRLISGESFADLTGGFGVDTYWMGKKMKAVFHIEPNQALQELVNFNSKILGFNQVTFTNSTAEVFLQQLPRQLDWIYLDPSRRVGADRKIGIAGYEPNIYELQTELLAGAKNILIKVSPMQDLAEIISSIKGVQKVLICEWDKEVKEVLIHISNTPIEEKNIVLEVHHLESGNVFSKKFSSRKDKLKCSAVKSYIFEPGPALQKSGLINNFAQSNNLTKAQEHSHLLYSDSPFISKLGKNFELIAVETLNKKKLLPYLPDKKANVIVRNFPMKAPAIKNKLGIKEGGEIYLIATKDLNDKPIILVAKRID